MARNTRGFRGRKIDFKQWTAAPGLLGSITTDTTTIGGSLAFSVPATILRWRGYISAFMGESGATAADRMAITCGIGIFSTDAVTLGATALPDPADEPEFPWVWWKEFVLHTEVAAGPSGGWGIQAQRYEIDSKAMRKVKPGESALIVIQSTNAAGAPTVKLDIGQLRVLVGT